MWMVTFLTVIGGSLLVLSASERSAHAIELDHTRAEYLALSALSELGVQAVEYFGLPADQRAVELGDELVKQELIGRDIPMGEGVVRLALHDESAKLNLNGSSETILRSLCAALGLPNPPALAREIVNWRTDHRPFINIEELSDVSGVTPAILATLSSFLSLYAPGPVNPNTASEPVLRACVEESKRQYEEMLQKPQNKPPDPPPEVSAILQGRPWTAQKLQEELKGWASPYRVQSRMFRVEATGMIRRRSCVVTMVGDVLQMTTGGPPAAEWRTYRVEARRPPGS